MAAKGGLRAFGRRLQRMAPALTVDFLAIGVLGASVLGAAAAPSPVRAEGNADLAQTARSVVRVSLIQRDAKGGLYLYGHGSGFVAAHGVVVTNWHVVSDANGRSDLLVWITPHEGLGERAVSGRITFYNSAADLALIEAPNLNAPSALIADGPPAHMSTVHAMGYPELPCALLHCTADEKIAPSTPDFSSGAISRFADRTPEGAPIRTIFHRAAISGGNSGGPLVDDCGRVVASTPGSQAAPSRDGDRSRRRHPCRSRPTPRR